MNLEAKISEQLWSEIKANYESRNFAGAILDSIHYLSETIRQKTGLEADGTALAGQAFGGKAPRLKVNKLQTESEQNVQAGIEQLLRGIYQAFRNPRSHGKIIDNQEDADSIIVFIDYVIKIIDQSKTQFSISEFIPRVFDKGFVTGERYSQLLIEEIPIKKRSEVYLTVFKKRQTGDGNKLQHFLYSLFKSLTAEEQSEILNLFSEEFKVADEDSAIRTAVQVMLPECWSKISEVARIRIENMAISSIRDGKFISSTQSCKSGGFGTWFHNFLPHFSLRGQVLSVLVSKLVDGDRPEQDYVFRFFISAIREIEPQPRTFFISKLKAALKKGDKRFYNEFAVPFGAPDGYSTALEKELNEFVEDAVQEGQGIPPEDDDVPF